jgi:hypothetical protein
MIFRKETWDTVLFDNVADLGAGVRQYVRVYNHSAGMSARSACWEDVGAFADVEAGHTADAGRLTNLNEVNCPRVFSPSWLDDKTLSYLVIEPTVKIGTPTNVWSGTADSAPGLYAKRILDIQDLGVFDYLFALAAGPKSTEPQLALLRHGTFGSALLVGPLSDLGQLRQVGPGCPYGVICKLIGLAWRPDGQAVFYSEYKSTPGAPDAGEIHELSTTDRTILSLPGEVIGRVAASPDGRTIAFERAPRLTPTTPDSIRTGDKALCPCSIWLVDANGGDLRKLAEDGRAPAWGK